MRLPLAMSPRRIRQLWYVPVLATAMGLVMLRLLVLAHLLDVHAFAVFSGGLLVSSTFCMVSCLGLQSLLQRAWPVHLVRGQELRAMVTAAQCNLLALASALVLCLCAAAGVSLPGVEPRLLAAGVVHGAAQQVFLVATTESRSRGEALGYAWQQLTRAGLVFTLGAAAAASTASPMVVICAETLISASLALTIVHRSLARAALGWGSVLQLAVHRIPRVPWRSALTMMAVMLVGFVALNADRWVASHLLVQEGFAQYSFVAILLGVAQGAQSLINASVYPLLARRFASSGHAVTFRICLRASCWLLAVGVLVSVPMAGVLQYSVARWYPQYSEAIGLIPLLLAVAVLRISDFSSSYLLITGYERRLLVLNGATVVCGTLIWLAWATPWKGTPTTLWDISLLAALLSLLGSLGTAGAAWAVRRA